MIFSVASASQAEILDAIEKDSFADFEDCLQDKCAKEVSADYIIAANEKDFANSEIKAVNPYDFLEHLMNDMGKAQLFDSQPDIC